MNGQDALSAQHRISFRINGKDMVADVDPTILLVDFIRDQIRLKGTNIGCDTSQCGACTIILDGRPIKSCTMLAVQADGRELLTIEGVGEADGSFSKVQKAFHEHHALQCGYCTPGMVMTTIGMMNRGTNLSEKEIRENLDGNLCRCTGYHNIVQAISSLVNGEAR